MSRFDRQEMIDGWVQQKLENGHVAVAGRGWIGTFLVWALCSMGVGRVLWFGHPRQSTDRIAAWFLSDVCPFDGCSVIELPFDPHYDAGLEWGAAQAGGFPAICIDATEDDHSRSVLQRVFAEKHSAVLLAGGAANSGWIATTRDGSYFAGHPSGPDDPALAMAVAALLADAARVVLCPLPSDVATVEGCLGWESMASKPEHRCSAVLVGCGGIGVWAATLLALLGHDLLVVDGDHVELSNLPRQGLFTTDDAAERRNKAVAVKHRLCMLAPEANVLANPQRIDMSFLSTIQQTRPTSILSAVDNASSRLILQGLGQQAGVPVIQAGTDVFCADCFTQVPGGPLLDEQMHAVLSATARQETITAVGRGRCSIDPSWVVPGMLAGAMLARRFSQLDGDSEAQTLPPIRWRQGDIPRETWSMHDEPNAELDT